MGGKMIGRPAAAACALAGLALAGTVKPAAAQLRLPYNGSAGSDAPAFSVTNNGGGNGVRGTSPSGVGVVGLSETGFAAVAGSNQDGYGAYFFSINQDAIHGLSAGQGAGTYGDNGSSGPGLYGRSVNGPAIAGFSVNGPAGKFDGLVIMKGLLLDQPTQAGYVLMSDGNGNAHWAPLPSASGGGSNGGGSNGGGSNGGYGGNSGGGSNDGGDGGDGGDGDAVKRHIGAQQRQIRVLSAENAALRAQSQRMQAQLTALRRTVLEVQAALPRLKAKPRR